MYCIVCKVSAHTVWMFAHKALVFGRIAGDFF